jgi:hypothetical protein
MGAGTGKTLPVSSRQDLRIALPAIEVDESWMNKPPVPGARTSSFRFLHEEYGDHKLVLTAEGLAGTDASVTLTRNPHIDPKVETTPTAPSGAVQEFASISHRDCDADVYACKALPLLLHFPAGEGWKTITVTLNWQTQNGR